MTNIDLNSDLGESFGAWRMGDDSAMLEIVSSANVACGFHAAIRQVCGTPCKPLKPRVSRLAHTWLTGIWPDLDDATWT